MAIVNRMFVGSDLTFTASDNGIEVVGAAGTGAETLRIQSGVTGTLTDGNIERVELAGNLADYKFVAVAGTGIQIQDAAGNVVNTISSLNQDATIAFNDGSAVMQQTGSTAFTLGAQAISTTTAAGFVTTDLGTSFDTADQSTVTPPVVIPTFALTTGAASVNEGGTATFALVGGAASTTYTYNIAGVEAADVTGGLTGSVTTDANGAATISVVTVADRLTQGAQTLTVSLPNSTLTASTIVNDTSLNNVAPVITAAAPFTVAENAAAVIGTLVAVDAEADAVTFAVVTGDNGLTINANGTYSFDPALSTAAQALTPASANLVIPVTYTATDALGAATTGTLSITVTPKPLTFALTAAAPTVTEGGSVVYTVTASDPVVAPTDVVFTLLPGNGTAANAGTSTTNTVDFVSGAFNPLTVTIAAGATTATFSVSPSGADLTELPETFTVEAVVAGTTLTKSGTVLDDGIQTFNLVAAAEILNGGAGSDTFNGSNTTLILDTLNGNGGSDTLNYSDATGGKNINDLGLSLTSVETINARSIAAAAVDTSAFTGVENLNVTQSTTATVVAAATTAVNVSGATGKVMIDGGSTQTVTAGTLNQVIELGATTGAAGAINVTHTKQGTGTIDIDGRTTVTLATTVTNAAAAGLVGGAIKIGDTTQSSGAVAVTQNLISNGLDTLTGSAITVNGGSTVNVTVNATTTAKDNDSDADITVGALKVVAGNTTTDVTVNQNPTTNTFTKAAVAVVKETSVVTFAAMTTGQTLIVDSLTFTAAKNLTAEQVAAAFSNLAKSDTQSASGPTVNGVYTGTSSANYTSGAVSGKSVTFTAKDQDQTLAFGGTATAPTQVEAAGTAAAAKDESTNAVVYGAVRVDENATASVKSITLNGYASADLGDTGTDLNALQTLSLANSGGAATLATSATTLGLTLNKVKHAVDLDKTGATITTLNVNTTGSDSTFALTSIATTNLTVDGTNAVDLSGSTLNALKTVVVKTSAGLKLDAGVADTVTSIDTTATTGTVTASIDPTKATYTGGAGVDNVTTTAIAPTKAISLGAGNDTMTLFSGTTAMGALGTIDGGADTDTLSMVAANAQIASGTTAFALAVTGFEHLTLTGATGAQTVDVAKLGAYNYVTSAGRTGVADILTIDKLVSTGTLAITTAPTGADTTGSITVNVTDASVAGHTTDVLNVALSAAGALAAGRVYAADVETIIITTTDTTKDVVAGTNAHSLTLVDTAAKTITVSGNSAFTLINAGNTAVTSIDAHTMTGNLIVTAAGTVAETITGGAGNDTLTASSTTADPSVAQVSTLTFAQGAGPAAIAAGDSIAVTINGTTVTQLFSVDYATTMAALEVKTDAVAGYTTAYAANVLTITADVPGTPFTADAVFTSAGVTTLTDVFATTTANHVSASATGDILNGGAGNDTLVAGNLAQLTGGAGVDTFDMRTLTTNINSYATIIDALSGDKILTTATAFDSTGVVLAGTAVFDSFVNAAIAQTTDGEVIWFQKDGNTYVVENSTAHVSATFNSAEDTIIQIVGLVDLSTAAFSTSAHTIEIA